MMLETNLFLSTCVRLYVSMVSELSILVDPSPFLDTQKVNVNRLLSFLRT